jgi:hypothetical protein
MNCWEGTHRWSRSSNTTTMPPLQDHERCDCGMYAFGEFRYLERTVSEQRKTITTLTAERDAALARVTQACEDWAEDDTAIRNALRPLLGGACVDGNNDGVPSFVDLVNMVVARIESLRECVRTWGGSQNELIAEVCGEGPWVSDSTKELTERIEELEEVVTSSCTKRKSL